MGEIGSHMKPVDPRSTTFHHNQQHQPMRFARWSWKLIIMALLPCSCCKQWHREFNRITAAGYLKPIRLTVCNRRHLTGFCRSLVALQLQNNWVLPSRSSSVSWQRWLRCTVRGEFRSPGQQIKNPKCWTHHQLWTSHNTRLPSSGIYRCYNLASDFQTFIHQTTIKRVNKSKETMMSDL